MGPIFVGVEGGQMDRCCADRTVKRLTKKAGTDKRISPHSLRHSCITAALDAGVPLRDVQEAASHADHRTTTRYDAASTGTRRTSSQRSSPGQPDQGASSSLAARDAKGFLAVTFTNDFDAVAIGPASEGIAHFDLETGELSAVATGTVAPGGVYQDNGLEYTEDGRLLVAAGADGANLIYAATRQLLGQRFPTDELVESAADGGGFVVTGSQDLLLVWNLDPDAPPDIACHASGRNLTLEEWGQFGPADEPARATCPQWPSTESD